MSTALAQAPPRPVPGQIWRNRYGTTYRYIRVEAVTHSHIANIRVTEGGNDWLGGARQVWTLREAFTGTAWRDGKTFEFVRNGRR